MTDASNDCNNCRRRRAVPSRAGEEILLRAKSVIALRRMRLENALFIPGQDSTRVPKRTSAPLDLTAPHVDERLRYLEGVVRGFNDPPATTDNHLVPMSHRHRRRWPGIGAGGGAGVSSTDSRAAACGGSVTVCGGNCLFATGVLFFGLPTFLFLCFFTAASCFTATVSRSTVSAQIGHATIEAGSEVPSRSLEQIAEGIAEPPEHSLLGYLDLGPRSSASENP